MNYKELEERPYIDGFHYIEELGEKLQDRKLITINRFFQEDRIKKDKEIERLHSIIKEVREYIENNSLYEQDYDYDYEENLVEGPPSDETARKILLEILERENNDTRDI